MEPIQDSVRCRHWELRRIQEELSRIQVEGDFIRLVQGRQARSHLVANYSLFVVGG